MIISGGVWEGQFQEWVNKAGKARNRIYVQFTSPKIASGYSDIDNEQHKTVCLLQDDHTPVSKVDGIVSSLLHRLLMLVFGTKESPAVLLQPTVVPQYLLQSALKQLTGEGFHTKDMTAEVIDGAYAKIKQRAAKVMATWAKRFPARELVNGLAIFENTCSYGKRLEDPQSVESCIALLVKKHLKAARLGGELTGL